MIVKEINSNIETGPSVPVVAVCRDRTQEGSRSQSVGRDFAPAAFEQGSGKTPSGKVRTMRTRFNRPAGFVLALLGLVSGAALSHGQDAETRGRAKLAHPADSVSILDAERDGQVTLKVRGQGADSVRIVMGNNTDQRLKVILPPGLVAATSAAQGGQNMGGFRSIGVQPENPEVGAVIPIAPGETLDFKVAAVCLNYGLATPTPEFEFKLIDVADFTPDTRAQKALRNVAVLGAGYGVAQAVAWNVFNHMTFAQMAKEARRYLNTDEISVAARFVEALDASGTQELVDPAYFQNGRVLIRIHGENALAADADRLQKAFEGQRLLGLPVQVVDNVDGDTTRPSSLLVDVALVQDAARPDHLRALATVKHHSAQGGWDKLGNVSLPLGKSAASVGQDDLTLALDRGISAAFVKLVPDRKSRGVSTFRIINKLPLSINKVVLHTSRAVDAPEVSLNGLAIGPNRSGMASVPAANGILERIEFNGL